MQFNRVQSPAGPQLNPLPHPLPHHRPAQPGSVPLGKLVDELAPSARQKANAEQAGASSCRRAYQLREILRSVRKPALIVAALLAAGAVLTSGNRESGSEKWYHHEHANAQWNATAVLDTVQQEPMKWVHPLGPAKFGNLIPMSGADRDQATTDDVTGQLNSYGNFTAEAADQLVVAAQQNLKDPDSLETPLEDTPARPTLSAGMRAKLLQGQAGFYHIFLWDSCYEDGDVVDLYLDGHRFVTIPITNEGTTLTIPVTHGTGTAIAVRGVRDGAGGITIACRTSQGEGFVRVLEPGETQVLAVVRN